MENFTNTYAVKIYDILLPLMGEYMSKAAVRSRCEKMGISTEQIGAEKLATLGNSLKLGLAVFLGTEKAEEVVQKIRDIN